MHLGSLLYQSPDLLLRYSILKRSTKEMMENTDEVDNERMEQDKRGMKGQVEEEEGDREDHQHLREVVKDMKYRSIVIVEDVQFFAVRHPLQRKNWSFMLWLYIWVFWSLLPPDHHRPSMSVKSSLSLSFRLQVSSNMLNIQAQQGWSVVKAVQRKSKERGYKCAAHFHKQLSEFHNQ
ncbi:hypothetical protein K7X08_022158 [Anisodus acutangulus]|uniref:Uncharacterized protein n=1 Tax=Anisodus acutangulus TaxID=402998 RepID=A0A9Q1QX65_9SOLA|nr:hypothetical protein K7X08_022158 [Anisodus acutangulus]